MNAFVDEISRMNVSEVIRQNREVLAKTRRHESTKVLPRSERGSKENNTQKKIITNTTNTINTEIGGRKVSSEDEVFREVFGKIKRTKRIISGESLRNSNVEILEDITHDLRLINFGRLGKEGSGHVKRFKGKHHSL